MAIDSRQERERLALLESLEILDTAPEEPFDDVARIAAAICDVPISAISLVDSDRQWFKSAVGLAVSETPRNIAFCSHAIETPNELMVVPDTLHDERFVANPLVAGDPKIRFYAGAPLVIDGGKAVGTVCVIDTKPRVLTDDQAQALKALARRTVDQLNIRQTNKELALRNDELSQFSYRVSHDFKAPLSTAKRLSEFLVSDLDSNQLSEAKDNAKRIHRQMEKLESFVEDMLNLARADLAADNIELVEVEALVRNILAELEDSALKSDVQISLDIPAELTLDVSKIRLSQILKNLLLNSLKYRNPEQPTSFIKINWRKDESHQEILIDDNGIGIPKEFHESVGQPFTRFHPSNAEGSGLGLSIVYKHVRALKGSINFNSDASGTQFKIRLPDGPR